MSWVGRTVCALVLVVATCASLPAESNEARFGIGYVLAEANGSYGSFPTSTIEFRALPLALSARTRAGFDLKLSEGLAFSTFQTGYVAVRLDLAAAIRANDQVRLKAFLGPALRVFMDPSYGTDLSIGAVVGVGGEWFAVSLCSIGVDSGMAVSTAPDGIENTTFGDVILRFYFR